MTTTTMRPTIQPVAGFLAGSVVLGSLATALLARIPTNPMILPLVALPISYVPAVLAILLVRSEDPDERRAFRRRLIRWRLRAGWYVLAP